MSIRHIGFSIDGLLALSDYKLKRLAPCCRIDGVQLRTAGQVKKMLREAKGKGMESLLNPEGCLWPQRQMTCIYDTNMDCKKCFENNIKWIHSEKRRTVHAEDT